MTDPRIAWVTGGAGFIGSALSKSLVERFDKVIAIDNLLAQVHPEGQPAAGFDPRAELLIGDVTEAETWEKALSEGKPEVVVHLAAETGTGQSLRESTRHTLVNVVGTSLMLDQLRSHKAIPRRILLCSSRAVYGEGAWRYEAGPHAGELFYPGIRSTAMLESGQWDFSGAKPVAQDSRLVTVHPESVYGITKCAQENLLTLWGDAFGSEIVILRLQNVYGPGQTPGNPYTGIMSIFSRLALEGQVIPLYEDGLVRRDFVNIDDVTRACLLALEKKTPPRYPVDIGSGVYTTIAQAARIIARIYGAPEPEVTGQWRHGDVRHAWADPSGAEQALGFRSQVGLEQGLHMLTDWVNQIWQSHKS